MIGPVVTGLPVMSPVMLIGQAPGTREGPAGKPFAWTAGKTMFGWFDQLGLTEEDFRQRVYMAAVCRCFPGKAESGGDRVPDEDEVKRCSKHLATEARILQPKLVIPVEFAHRSVEELRAAGAEVLYRESPIDHAIDPAFVAELVPWLRAAGEA